MLFFCILLKSPLRSLRTKYTLIVSSYVRFTLYLPAISSRWAPTVTPSWDAWSPSPARTMLTSWRPSGPSWPSCGCGSSAWSCAPARWRSSPSRSVSTSSNRSSPSACHRTRASGCSQSAAYVSRALPISCLIVV